MEQSGQIDLFEVLEENPQHYSKLAYDWEKAEKEREELTNDPNTI